METKGELFTSFKTDDFNQSPAEHVTNANTFVDNSINESRGYHNGGFQTTNYDDGHHTADRSPTDVNVADRNRRRSTVRPPTWQMSVRAFCSEVSVLGVRYVANPSLSSWRRSVWLLLVLAGIGFTIWEFEDRIVYYTKYPVNVKFRIEYEKEIRFPTVTLCNENRASLSKASTLGVAEAMRAMFPPFPSPGFRPNFTGYDLDRMNISWGELYDQVAQSPQDMLLGCQFNSQWCSFEEHFDRIPTNLGFCVSFNPARTNYTSKQGGSSSGLQLFLHVGREDYLYANAPSDGFRILLHDPADEPPSMKERGLKVSPGFLTQIVVDAEYVNDLPSPYGQCEPANHYRRSTCLVNCLSDYVTGHCNCKDLYFPGEAPVCDPRTLYECVVVKYRQYLQDNEAVKCNCAQQCYQIRYHTTISQARLSDSISRYFDDLNGTAEDAKNDQCIVEIFFSDIKYTYVDTVPAYTWLGLLCDIGGALGLILGSTVLTFCEIIDFLVFALPRSCRCCNVR